jgi:hypothetical protein
MEPTDQASGSQSPGKGTVAPDMAPNPDQEIARLRGAMRSAAGTPAYAGLKARVRKLESARYAASQAPSPVISIVYGSVRVAMAASWADARVLLSAHVDAIYSRIPGDWARQTHERVQGRVALGAVDDRGWLWVSDLRKTQHFAAEGRHGLTTGDLCLIHEFTNGSRNWWTVDVKAKIVSVGPVGAVVRVTGESVQFDRYSVVTIPLSFIRPRARGTR